MSDLVGSPENRLSLAHDAAHVSSLFLINLFTSFLSYLQIDFAQNQSDSNIEILS